LKYSQFPYERIDLDAVLAQTEDIRQKLENAENYDTFLEAFKENDKLLRHISTLESLASTRHTIDTNDEFYAAESDFFDEVMPVISTAQTAVAKTVLNSPYAKQLHKDVPETWFALNENALKTVDEKIIPDMQEENKTASEYQKLIASAQIEFDGKTYTLAGLEEKANDKDPKVRERAHKAGWAWFAENEKELGDIYDRLVKIRTRIAKKMGYENYIPFGYLRMNRLDYDQNDVEQYRKNILEDVVPVASELYQSQIKRLGLGDTLKSWNNAVVFKDGNPTPKYEEEQLVQNALQMYKELDPKTGEFFQVMVDQELLDLASKPGKAAGGYCTSFPDYGVPFIFANFNNTQHDAEVLTHEAGHAFQAYSAKDVFPMECVWPTMESAEITSMSMEFFTWPWMKSFFEEDTDKYYYSHLTGAVKFLPYGVLVDHFQHEVYAHPEWNHEERKAKWRELEKQYLPHKDYADIDILESGGWWLRQQHIFLNPFYYIDYTLAQVVALQFWKRLMDKDPNAFEDYKAVASAGGTLPFKKLVEKANVRVPFEQGCLKDTMQSVKEWAAAHEPKE
jgi:M3 family oligoendopeptidase